MRIAIPIPAYLILLTSILLMSAAAQHQHALTSDELGSVDFKTSCAKSVSADFNRAVALLHSFQYEQSDQAFEAVAARDPQCAMAQWGIAMANYHGLWDSGNAAKSKAAITKAQSIAAAGKTSTREKAYLDAFAQLYKDDGKDKFAHANAFEQSMGAVQAAYPDDQEAAIFHALTLAITAPKTDKTFANQRKCGQILEPIFTRLPHHPGVAHYIIHCDDNPVLATQGLGAARAYAKIAPASPHANHMPSHIFTRVGSWQESIVSNKKSAEIATKDEAISRSGEARDQRLHALDYLEYAYLQTGEVSKAKAVREEVESLQPIAGLTQTGNYASSAIPARFTIELGQWKQASDLKVDPSATPSTQALTWTAIGVGSARSGNIAKATEAEKNLASIREALAAKKDTYWSNQVEVQRREVAAWISEANGKSSDAIANMRSAAELEESMDKHAVTPGAVIPAREMLAQLLAKDHPQQALAEYQAVLKSAPNRFNATYGAAMAARAAGDPATAAKLLRDLSTFTVGDEREELKAAKLARAGN
jgi:hypothetical protein